MRLSYPNPMNDTLSPPGSVNKSLIQVKLKRSIRVNVGEEIELTLEFLVHVPASNQTTKSKNQKHEEDGEKKRKIKSGEEKNLLLEIWRLA